MVDDWFTETDVGVIFGDSGTGKTFVALDLAVAVMLEKNFARRFPINQTMKVAYWAGEGKVGLMNRFKAALNQYNLPENFKAALSIHLGVSDMSNSEDVRRYIHYQ